MAAVLSFLNVIFTKLNDNIASLCGLMLFFYMLNIVADVAGRYLFLSPIIGTIEIGENVLAISVFMTMAAVEMKKENMRVTLLLDRLGVRSRVLLDILALVCGLFLMGFMTWQALVLAMRSFEINEVGANFPLPLYIGKFAFFIGCTLLCLQFLHRLVHLCFTVINPRYHNEKGGNE